MIGFGALAGAGLATDAPFPWQTGAGVQPWGALTDVPPGIKVDLLPVHFASQAFMSLPDIFSALQAAVIASGENEAKDATPSGFTLTAAAPALPLHAEAQGDITHSGGHGVHFCASAEEIANPAAKKKIINTFFITNRISE